MENMTERVSAEVSRLRGFIEGLSDKRIGTLMPVIENVAWMKIKLDDARDGIRTAQIVIPYDNGGGQTGIRENPMFRGYEALWKSYVQGMNMILQSLPEEAIEKAIPDEAAPKTVLELVRDKHKRGA